MGTHLFDATLWAADLKTRRCCAHLCTMEVHPNSKCFMCNDALYCEAHHQTCSGCPLALCATCVVGHRQCAKDNCFSCCEKSKADCLFCNTSYCKSHSENIRRCVQCAAPRCNTCYNYGRGRPHCGSCHVKHRYDVYQWHKY